MTNNTNSVSELNHETYMNLALDLAKKGLGRTAPNPTVGCVIVRDDGVILAEARTQDGGRPHAEAHALSEAGAHAKGASVYVTLEPCSHHGQTPPCAQALIDSGVKTVIIACKDPDPRVSGRGIEMLKHAGIEVILGVCEEQALQINKGFFLSITQKRPLVTLKMAVSKDNMVAGHKGKRTAISGDASIKHMHQNLRASHDAIMIGMNTAINDDPLLTTRHLDNKPPHNAKKFIIGNPSRLPEGHRLTQLGVHVIRAHDISEILAQLIEKHSITRLLVEGGTTLMSAFLKSQLWDELYIYHGQKTIGSNGVKAPNFAEYGLQLKEMQNIGGDRLAIYRPRD